MSKSLVVLGLFFMPFLLKAQFLELVTKTDGDTIIIGLSELRHVLEDPSGSGSIIIYTFRHERYFVTNTIQEIADNSCGTIFLVTDRNSIYPAYNTIGINKEWVDFIGSEPDGRAYVMVENSNYRFELTEQFNDLDAILACTGTTTATWQFKVTDETNTSTITYNKNVTFRAGDLLNVSVQDTGIVHYVIDASTADPNDVIKYVGGEVKWDTDGGGPSTDTFHNALTRVDSSLVEFGGALVKNTVVDMTNYNMTWQNGGVYTVESGNLDKMIVDDTSARFEGAGGSYIQIDNIDFKLDALGGQTYWAYGAESFELGSVIQLIDAGTNEIRYSPYGLPITAPGPSQFLASGLDSVLYWADSLAGLGDDWGNQVAITDNIHVFGDGTEGNPIRVDTSSFGDNWGTQVAVTDGVTVGGTGVAGDPITAIITGDDWGNGGFTFIGDAGSEQTITSNDQIFYVGKGLISTSAVNTDILEIMITPGANDTYIKTENGVVGWSAGVGDDWGAGSFTLTGDTGPSQTVVSGESVDINGLGIISTIAKASDGVDIKIDGGSATQILITNDAGDAVWYTIPECASGAVGYMCYEICEGKKTVIIKS